VVNIGPSVEEKFEGFKFPIIGSTKDWSLALVVRVIHIGSGSEE